MVGRIGRYGLKQKGTSDFELPASRIELAVKKVEAWVLRGEPTRFVERFLGCPEIRPDQH